MAPVFTQNPQCNLLSPGTSGQHMLPETNSALTRQLNFLASVQQEGFLCSAHAGRRII